MRKSYWAIPIVILLLVALILPACAPAPSPAQVQKTGTLKLSYTVPKGKTYAIGLDDFAEQFQKATNGRYKVEVYPANSLVTLPEAWDATVGRKAEIVVTSVGMFLTRFPLMALMGVPTMGWSQESPEDFEKGWAANWELINAFPEVAKEFTGIKLLNPMMMDPFFFISKKKEVKVPADLKGMKVGGAAYDRDLYTSLGAAAVHQMPPMAYMNMDKGVIDACAFTFGMVHDWKMHEVASYMLTQVMTQVQLLLIMNQEAWNELSPADQKTFEDVLKKSLKLSAKGAFDSQGLGRDLWIKSGHKIYNPTPAERALWDAAAKPIIAKWKEDAVKAGVSPAICDKVLNKWLEIKKKYGK